jgi:para-aminobenzoate synthetase / 4-amino-4-deoxychorismate lyase
MDTIKRNEVLIRDGHEWLYFKDPYQIITAATIDDVTASLAEVERRVDGNGWHAAGFLSYEAASAFEPMIPRRPATRFPYLWFGLYPTPATINLPAPAHPREVLDWSPNVGRDIYNTAINKIREYIADGRTYQVNYTMPLHSDFNTSPWEFFLHLARTQNNHAAYVDAGRYVICSASPELFFRLDGSMITCRPMKGTVRRGRTTREDQARADWMKNSEKNRAENVMIVDMIRNDLGRIARVGSVDVPELFQVERYPSLWQMTSTVTAQTKASLTEIFHALFPCASITGAPKISTMRIIHELETTPRRIYTGAIGYIAPHRKAKFNVAIRTALIDRQEQIAEYGIGGGIVWDSTSSDEYAEALLKAGVLTNASPEFSLLETLLWTPKDGYFLKKKHIERLLDSADYFDFPAQSRLIEEDLERAALSFLQPQRVRLLLDRDGKITTESAQILLEEKLVHARLAEMPVDSKNVFLFHKTTQRAVYDMARAPFSDCDDVLLYNENHELTEFTIGNLVVELDGELVTPPIECGVLAGTFRAHLLETRQVRERIVPLDRLKDCTQIYRVNSVRKWETVQIQEYNR